MRKFKLAVAAFLLFFCFGFGCSPAAKYGIGKRPVIKAPDPLEYTPEEQGALAAFAADHPELARKIVNQSQALRKCIDEYNARAWDVNAAQLKELGYSDEDVARMLGEKPKP